VKLKIVLPLWQWKDKQQQQNGRYTNAATGHDEQL